MTWTRDLARTRLEKARNAFQLGKYWALLWSLRAPLLDLARTSLPFLLGTDWRRSKTSGYWSWKGRRGNLLENI